jgi:hypothetical protein
MTDIKVGDIVLVRHTIVAISDVGEPIVSQIREAAPLITLYRSDIFHVEPRQFKVGDRVRNNCISPQCMTIVAIDGPFAWIKTDDPRTRYTCSLNQLTPAETK